MSITKIPGVAYPEEPVADRPEYAELAEAAVEALDEGFPWDETAEGEEFWFGVRNRLKAISMGEALR